MADLRKLKDKAADLASKGKVEKAAEVFRAILRADPRDVASCQKLAEVLRRGGEIAEAVERYAQVAERFARDGLLIKAIAICKTILELDPEHAHTQALLADLYSRRAITDAARPPVRTQMAIPAVRPPPPGTEAGIELTVEPEMEIERGVALPLRPPARPAAEHPAPADPFAPVPGRPVTFDPSELPSELQVGGGAIRLGPVDEPVGPPSGPAPEPEVVRHRTHFDLIVAAAAEAVEAGVEEEVSIDVEGVDDEVLELVEIEAAPEPPPAAEPPPPAELHLPRVPIFSDLSPEAFVALTEKLSVTRLGAGQTVITEGEEGSAFYVVATGRLTVMRRDENGEQVVLAHLGEGEFFGEMALLSQGPRNATVVAEEPSEVLVLQADVLQELAGRFPHVADSLRRFYRQRLLANALAISPLFRPFGRSDRKALMERFRERPVRAGEVIIREGTQADGLYVVLEGALDVTHRKEAAEVLVGHLREGDLFGEISCLRKTGATATVTVRRAGALLRLQRPDFDALVMTYPTVLELMSTLSDERAQNLDAILSGSAEFTEDGLVLI
jgi:CRP-like cAMP-binding protein